MSGLTWVSSRSSGSRGPVSHTSPCRDMSSAGSDRLVVKLLLPWGGFAFLAAPVSLTTGNSFCYSFSTAVSQIFTINEECIKERCAIARSAGSFVLVEVTGAARISAVSHSAHWGTRTSVLAPRSLCTLSRDIVTSRWVCLFIIMRKYKWHCQARSWSAGRGGCMPVFCVEQWFSLKPLWQWTAE